MVRKLNGFKLYTTRERKFRLSILNPLIYMMIYDMTGKRSPFFQVREAPVFLELAGFQ